jgi:hypothetical protein
MLRQDKFVFVKPIDCVRKEQIKKSGKVIIWGRHTFNAILIKTNDYCMKKYFLYFMSTVMLLAMASGKLNAQSQMTMTTAPQT